MDFNKCRHCNGVGKNWNGSECLGCFGTGNINGQKATESICPNCQGSGETFSSKQERFIDCGTCFGKGKVPW